MPTDIFIKTYHGDFCWLDGCLKSIKKFCSGFRDVVIVSDDGKLLPPKLLEILPVKVFYVPITDKFPENMAVGVGYAWQQNIKLEWYKYTDADMVIVVDSDEMFTSQVTPEHFMTNGKLNWWARTWAEVPECKFHKPSTDLILQTDTPYETMIFPVFPLHRQTTIECIQYLCKLHDVSCFWDIILKHNLKHISEYNIFGNYINLLKPPVYNLRLDLTNAFNYHAIKVDWSWGGLTPENIKEREKILSCE
jgi:hypothetical protein